MFYKHMSQVFEMYLELISKAEASSKEGGESVQKAYKELGSFIDQLLTVMIEE